jgi:glycosyltransferase involved in cell wall biosynthesis
MAERPRLLFLSQTLPYPPDGGVKIRTYHVLRQLARVFDVTALCFYRWKPGAHEPDVEEALGALREFGRVEAFPIPQEHSRARLLWDHLRSLVRQQVYTVYVYDSRDFRSRLRAILAGNRFDLVHADSLDLSGYFALCRDIPLICVHHDAQSTLLRRRAQHETKPLRRAYTALQARLMAREERRWCPRVALNVAVSEPDRDSLAREAPGGSFTVVPNGVDLDAFQPSCYGDAEGMVFVGGSSWFPNADAMQHFCTAILPLVRRAQPVAEMTWVGRTTQEEREGFAERFGVRVTGYVADIRPFVRGAACYVVPIRIGAGTRIKILDAWAMGKAVVSTSIGCEGLRTVDGENILVRDEPHAFAEAVNLVLCDRDLRARLGEAARATVEAYYGWDGIGRRMTMRYLDTCRQEVR